METESHLETIFESDLIRICDFECREEPHSKSEAEAFDSYQIAVSRKGYFFMTLNKKHYDIYTEYLMLGNPGVEYSVMHGEHVYDECTVIKINRSLLEEARSIYWKKDFNLKNVPDNKDEIIFPLPALKSNPRIDSTHLLLLNSLKDKKNREPLLKVELLTLSLIEDVFREFYSGYDAAEKTPAFKAIHLNTVEFAKTFVAENFSRDISLSEIASSSFLTPFHFTRIFKKYTGLSPYNYLVQFRLKYAALLLLSTNLTETEICFKSGFNNFSHFISTFTRVFNTNPRKFRNSRKGFSFKL